MVPYEVIFTFALVVHILKHLENRYHDQYVYLLCILIKFPDSSYCEPVYIIYNILFNNYYYII